MKLVKIEDVRVGQVWIVEFDTNRAIVIKNVESEQIDVDVFADKQFYCENNFNKDISGLELIGFLGITHEIKDNKLVEIQRANPPISEHCRERIREDLVVDDVIEFYAYGLKEHTLNIGAIITNNYYAKIFTGKEIKEPFQPEWILNKIGIYGVTHEFINERLVR